MSFLSEMTWPQSWTMRFALSLRTFGLVLILIVMVVVAFTRPEQLFTALVVVVIAAHFLAGLQATLMKPGVNFWRPGQRD